MKTYRHKKHLPIFIRVLFVAAILCTPCTQMIAQTKSLQEVDSNTYTQYMKQDWETLIKEGTDALDSGIDFFYLRMRIGYAYFKQKKYRNAIVHYKRAWTMNRWDANAQYYLMLCYEYSGRSNEALKFSTHISEKKWPIIANKYKKDILKAGLFYSYATSNATPVKTKLSQNQNLSTNGIQKTTRYFHNTNAIVSHKLGRSVIAHHSLEYLNKCDDDFITADQASIITSNQLVHQWNYGIHLQVTPTGGFSIRPGINFISIQVPFDDSSIETFKEHTTLYTLKLEQELTKMKLGTSLFAGTLNGITTLQTGAHLTWYPQSNLNLYYTLDAYWHEQKRQQKTKNNFIHKHTIGFKIAHYWWAETSVLPPEFYHFYDFSNGALYNSLEGTKSAVHLNNIFLISNSGLSIILGVSFNTGVSTFVPTNSPLLKSNSLTYNRLIFTGGIVWKL